MHMYARTYVCIRMRYDVHGIVCVRMQVNYVCEYNVRFRMHRVDKMHLMM